MKILILDDEFTSIEVKYYQDLLGIYQILEATCLITGRPVNVRKFKGDHSIKGNYVWEVFMAHIEDMKKEKEDEPDVCRGG